MCLRPRCASICLSENVAEVIILSLVSHHKLLSRERVWPWVNTKLILSPCLRMH